MLYTYYDHGQPLSFSRKNFSTILSSKGVTGLDPIMLPNQSSYIPVRNYSSLAALVILLLECISNIHSEYTYVWRARHTVVKYIYLLSRYLGLTALLVHNVLIHVVPTDDSVKPELCRVWYLFLFVVCAIIIAALDVILLLRVYALYLYKKNAKVHILALPIILQFIVASIQIDRVSRCHNFTSYCHRSTSLKDAGLTGGSVVLAHASLLVATLAKRNVAEGRAVVVRLAVRESAGIVFVLFGIVAGQSAYAVVSDSSNPFTFFVWPTAIMSAITCKIILSMNKLKIEQQGEIDSSLTTIERSSCDICNNEESV